jgi:Rieske Fe-S protein
VFAAAKVVVTQPSAGKFSVQNGSVVAGPAPSPLPEKSINVAGGKITLA